MRRHRIRLVMFIAGTPATERLTKLGNLEICGLPLGSLIRHSVMSGGSMSSNA